jgi:hypothetical protein
MIMLDVHLTLLGNGFGICDTVVCGVYKKDAAFFNNRATPLRLPDPQSLIPNCYNLTLFGHSLWPIHVFGTLGKPL